MLHKLLGHETAGLIGVIDSQRRAFSGGEILAIWLA
jgi:hypothetical protein